MQDYSRMTILKRIEHKKRHFEDFKYQKEYLSQKRKEVKDEIARKKIEYKEKFDLIFKSKNLDDKAINALTPILGGNEELIQMIKTLKTDNSGQKKRPHSSTANSNNNKFKLNSNLKSNMKERNIETHNNEEPAVKPITDLNMYKKSNNSNKKLNTNKAKTANSHSELNTNFKTKTINSYNINSISHKETNISNDNMQKSNQKKLEREVLIQIDEFRHKLNEELLMMLTEEKLKEENREKSLINCHDRDERSKLENLFGVERANAANKINQFNEQLEKKIREFELKMKNYKNPKYKITG